MNRHQVADLATNLLHRVEVLEWKNDALLNLLADLVKVTCDDPVERLELRKVIGKLLVRERVVRTRKDGNVVFFPYPKREDTP